MKHVVSRMTAITLLLTALPVAAQDLSAASLAGINEALAAIQCEVAPENIEAENDGYELDDVFCADGQYDMRMDATFAVIEKTKE